MSKHTLTLTFETTKELLEFTSKHLNPIEITSSLTPHQVQLRDEVVATGVATLPMGAGKSAGTDAEEPKKARAKKAKVEEAEPVKDEPKATAADLSMAEDAADEEAPKTAAKKVEKAADEAEPEVLDYKTHVRQHAMALLKKPDGQERMFKIYDEFGVTAATEITVPQLPAFRDALIKAMEE